MQRQPWMLNARSRCNGIHALISRGVLPLQPMHRQMRYQLEQSIGRRRRLGCQVKCGFDSLRCGNSTPHNVNAQRFLQVLMGFA